MWWLTVWFTDANFSDKPAISVFRVGKEMKEKMCLDKTVSRLSLPLHYLKPHCDRTSPACLDMSLHVLNQPKLTAAILSNTVITHKQYCVCHVSYLRCMRVWNHVCVCVCVCVCLILCKTQKMRPETYGLINTTFWNEVTSHTRAIKLFCTSVESEEHSGCHSSSRNDEAIAKCIVWWQQTKDSPLGM